MITNVYLIGCVHRICNFDDKTRGGWEISVPLFCHVRWLQSTSPPAVFPLIFCEPVYLSKITWDMLMLHLQSCSLQRFVAVEFFHPLPNVWLNHILQASLQTPITITHHCSRLLSSLEYSNICIPLAAQQGTISNRNANIKMAPDCQPRPIGHHNLSFTN